MGDEVDSQDDFFGEMPANKKLTIYVIDGSEKMFNGGQDCDFRRALEVVFHQILKVCCSGSFNHMVGLIITNTEKTKSRNDQRYSYEWIELAVPGKEETNEIKTLLDADDIHKVFVSKFGGHGSCDLGNVIWSCKKIMSISATSYRHHMIMYLSNNPNPFVQDPAMFNRLQRVVADFCCTSYRDINGQRKVNKTPGEFHVLMLTENIEKAEREKWEAITPNIFTGDSDELDLQAYKRTFTQRAFSSIPFELGPGVKLGVSVYTLCTETRPPTRVLLDAETEAELAKRTFYMPKSAVENASSQDDDTVKEEEDADEKTVEGFDPMTDDRARARFDLKRAIKVGGEMIVSEQKDLDQLTRFDAKGIVLLGFKKISDLDLTAQLQPSQFLYPDDSRIHGSTRVYRALLDRCLARQMAMICRFCSRSNQKVRLVALIPEDKKKLTESDLDGVPEEKREKIEQEAAAENDYRHYGFHVVFLPFAEDIRDVSEKMQCPEGGEWYSPNSSDVDVSRRFVRNLTKPYLPENFYNPRLRSFNSMLIEAAVGEETEREDTLLPYHKTKSATFVEKLTTPLLAHFQLNEDDIPTGGSTQKRAATSTAGGAKRAKQDTSQMSTEELARNGMLSSLTVPQLRAAIGELACGKVPTGAKKQQLVDMVSAHFNV